MATTSQKTLPHDGEYFVVLRRYFAQSGGLNTPNKSADRLHNVKLLYSSRMMSYSRRLNIPQPVMMQTYNIVSFKRCT